MVKKSDNESFELQSSRVGGGSFDDDVERGANNGNNEIFPTSTDAHDLNLVRNKFDSIATGSYARLSFRNLKRRKLFIVLLFFAVVSIFGLSFYAFNDNATSTLEYYSQKLKGGNSEPSTENVIPENTETSPAENDKSLSNASQGDGNNESENSSEPAKEETQENENPASDEQDSKETETNKGSNESSDDGNKQDSATEEPQEESKETTNEASKEEVKEEPKAKEETESKKKPQVSAPNIRKGKLTMKDVMGPSFMVWNSDLQFVQPEASKRAETSDEGLYVIRNENNIEAHKASDIKFNQEISPELKFQHKSTEYLIKSFVPNYELTYAIVQTDSQKVFRHSSISHYWLYNIKSKKFTPLAVENEELSKFSFAFWSPNYNYVTLVFQNDVYLFDLKSTKIERVTDDGSELIYNGRTDWVYEEEVLATDSAIWWSPDETNFVYLKIDDSKVPKYNLDYYVPDSDALKYPQSKKISYPRPGFPNPQVSLHLYQVSEKKKTKLERRDSKLGDEIVIYGVIYLDEDTLLVKESDRESNVLNYRRYSPKTLRSKVLHEVNAADDYNGWIEKLNDPILIPPSKDSSDVGSSSWGFVDILVGNGYNHLFYFKSRDDKDPTLLTSGDWEVLSKELGYDKDTRTVFFAANKRDSIDSHIYSVNLETLEIKAVTDDLDSGYYSARFSPFSKFCIMNYEGPSNPSQKLIKLEGYEQILQLSSDAMLTLSKNKLELPTKSFHRIIVDRNEDVNEDVELNVQEILPPQFDPKAKHPLLIHFYAGPGSQYVTSRFDVGFQDLVSSSLKAVVLIIEPRGTAGQGWAFRSWAKRNIGKWEPQDIIKITKQWIDNKDYIDAENVALWGWSYGGFTTLKTLEVDGGETFKYGMAVAPVTNWLFYDSIYTERYMDKPENNEEGYGVSQIKDMKNLAKVERFLVMHGTADDNVHIQNTWSLLDQMDLNGNENYDVHVFPDSDHSILHHNANKIVYDKLFSWLKDAFEGDLKQIGHK